MAGDEAGDFHEVIDFRDGRVAILVATHLGTAGPRRRSPTTSAASCGGDFM